MINKIPNLYLLSTILVVFANLLVRFTQVHFIIIYMILGVLVYLPNFWIGSQFGLKISLFLKEYEPELYRKYKINNKYKGVFFVSSKIQKDKLLYNKLNAEYKYVLNKYVQAVGNIKYTFLILLLSLLFTSFFILN